jgi:Flp pilus assembly protein TadD
MIAMKRIPLTFSVALAIAVPLAAQDADESVLDQFDQAKTAKPGFDSPASVDLRDAVRRMAARPNDPVALSDAGYASLKLGDAAAALNFFNRANSLQPGNARTVGGLAAAMVRTENPFEALRYFDEAVKLGASERSIALDRALAFDLLGNFGRAQQDYQLARSFGSSDELTRRHAMSLSMAGMANEADGMLVPLLQRNDPEAWRARAMMLAARGQLKEAAQITQGFLTPDAARRMEGFLRQMPRMTDAQRAAAMHFGHFPVGRLGEDTPEIRRVATANPPTKVASAASGQDRLIPAGAPLGSAAKKPASSKKDDRKAKSDDRRIASATPAPGFSTSVAQQKVEEAAKAKPVVIAAGALPPPDAARPPVKVILPGALPPTAPVIPAKPETKVETIAATTQQSASDAVRERQQAAAAAAIPAPVTGKADPVTISPVEPAIRPAPAIAAAEREGRVVALDAPPPQAAVTNGAAQGPMPDGASVVRPSISVENPPIAPASTPAAAAAFDLDAVVRSIEIPESEQQPKVAAVDLKAIQRAQARVDADAAAKEKAKTEAKKPVEPARIWVQVATGAEAALGGDYRRFARKSPDLFKGKEGWTSVWGRSSRLLVGPFPDNKSAKKWETEYRKAGGNGFLWQSETGTPVKKLAAK